MKFQEWFNSAPHRAKYDNDHPAYLAAQEAWQAAHEACAKVCDELIADTPDNDPDSDAIGACAIAIRARSNP